jgi:hypothetical protein
MPHQPNSKHRALVTPSKRGKNVRREITGDELSPVEQHAVMSCTRGHKGATLETSVHQK